MRTRSSCGSRVLLFAAALPLLAQHGNVTVSNPYNGREDREVGAKLFASHCMGCHGKDGSGGSAPDLTTGIYKHGGSDDGLYQSIWKGIPGTPMPPSALNGREIWQLVGFVRSLSEGRAAEKATGDPARGVSVFAANGCRNCHSIAGEGGQIGPELTDIGARRSLAQLQSSVLRPDEDVPLEYWSLRARTKKGASISGIRLNEDTFSFQILDSKARLVSISKEELASHEIVKTSPMPSFEGKLKGPQFDDLIAYLASLRGQKGNTK